MRHRAVPLEKMIGGSVDVQRREECKQDQRDRDRFCGCNNPSSSSTGGHSVERADSDGIGTRTAPFLFLQSVDHQQSIFACSQGLKLALMVQSHFPIASF